MMKSNKVAGLVISSRTKGIDQYLNGNFPVVSFERIISEKCSSVTCDNYEGGKLAAQHLIDSGCRNLICITGDSSLHMAANNRAIAFEDYCKSKSIPCQVFVTQEAEFQSMDYLNSLERIVQNHPDADGYFTTGDIIAMQLIKICKKHHINVPDNAKIVGFDDTYIATYSDPPLTTIHQPIDTMCKFAIDTILHYDSNNQTPIRSSLGVTLIKRGTT